jgi:CRP/FNR family transcriptional regulator, cyclic AMP receptor protein
VLLARIMALGRCIWLVGYFVSCTGGPARVLSMKIDWPIKDSGLDAVFDGRMAMTKLESAGPKAVNDAAVLKRCSIFSTLSEEERRHLAERSHRRRFSAGDLIFRFGDPGHSMMAVLTGTVRISRPTTKAKEIILGDLGPGEIIGEIAVLDGKERSADAAAVTNVELLVLDRREILPFIEQHPALCLRLLSLICARLRLADERMADIGFVDLRTRLAKTLLRLAYSNRKKDEPFKLSFSQAELAEMICGTRESVNRQLREWERQEVVGLKGGWILVRKQQALADLAAAMDAGVSP